MATKIDEAKFGALISFLSVSSGRIFDGNEVGALRQKMIGMLIGEPAPTVNFKKIEAIKALRETAHIDMFRPTPGGHLLGLKEAKDIVELISTFITVEMPRD